MKKLLFILVIGTLFITGCFKYQFNYQDPANRYFNLNYIATIHVNQTLTNEAENISITFDSVKNDSRCPRGAECVWVGDAAVAFHYKKNGNSINFTLNTFTGFGSDTTIDHYNIQLVELLPYPKVNTQMNFDKYYAKILVRKISTK